MTIAHIAVGMFVLSITVVESYTIERDVALKAGETVQLGRYAYRFDSIGPIEGPNYDAVRAELTVFRDGKEISKLHPEKRNYWVQRQVMTEAGIDVRLTKDIFAALGEDLGGGGWSIRAQIRPLINYVWLAAFLMALGGAIAATDRRYRLAGATEPSASGAGEALEGART
jgi:cytochrome c-type biogenesis protein CcmF